MAKSRAKRKKAKAAAPPPEPVAAPTPPSPDEIKGRRLDPRWVRLIIGLVLIVLIGLTVWARIDPVRDVIYRKNGDIRLLSVDPYYHLRHTRYVLNNFPRIQRMDVGTHYPWAETAQHPGLFNIGIAVGAMALGGDETALRTASAWAPVVLAVCSVLLLFSIGTLMGSPWLGLGACLIYFLYPGRSLDRTLLGFSDHHAAEITMGLATLTGWMWALRKGRGWAGALVGAIPLALFHFTWLGCPVVDLTFGYTLVIVFGVGIATGHDMVELSKASFRCGVLAFVLVLGIGLAWSELRMDGYLWLLSLILLVAVTLSAPVITFLGEKIPNRTVQAIHGIGVIAVAIGLMLVCKYLPATQGYFNALFETRTQNVLEHVPVTWEQLSFLYGPLPLLALLGLVWGLTDARDPVTLLPLAFGGLVTALWWLTRDYGYQSGAFFALATAGLVYGVCRRFPKAIWGAAPIVAIAMAVPLAGDGTVRGFRTTTTEVDRALLATDGWVTAMKWMKENTPQPTLPVDANVPPGKNRDYPFPEGTYGVMATWEFGNLISALGYRTPIWSRAPTKRDARWMMAKSNKKANRSIQRYCRETEEVRYAVLGVHNLTETFDARAALIGHKTGEVLYGEKMWTFQGREVPLAYFSGAYARSTANRLYFEHGEGRRRYRLIYSSPQQSFIAYRGTVSGNGVDFSRIAEPIDTREKYEKFRDMLRPKVVNDSEGYTYDGRIVPEVKIFEYIRGARIQGIAPPDFEVTAKLDVFNPTNGRRYTVRRSSRARYDGRFRIRLMYATEIVPHVSIQPEGPWRIEVTGTKEPLEIQVTEEEVQIGARKFVGVIGEALAPSAKDESP